MFQILYECLCMWNVSNLAFDPRDPFCKSLPVSQAPPPKSCQQPELRQTRVEGKDYEVLREEKSSQDAVDSKILV